MQKYVEIRVIPWYEFYAAKIVEMNGAIEMCRKFVRKFNMLEIVFTLSVDRMKKWNNILSWNISSVM